MLISLNFSLLSCRLHGNSLLHGECRDLIPIWIFLCTAQYIAASMQNECNCWYVAIFLKHHKNNTSSCAKNYNDVFESTDFYLTFFVLSCCHTTWRMYWIKGKTDHIKNLCLTLLISNKNSRTWCLHDKTRGWCSFCITFLEVWMNEK